MLGCLVKKLTWIISAVLWYCDSLCLSLTFFWMSFYPFTYSGCPYPLSAHLSDTKRWCRSIQIPSPPCEFLYFSFITVFCIAPLQDYLSPPPLTSPPPVSSYPVLPPHSVSPFLLFLFLNLLFISSLIWCDIYHLLLMSDDAFFCIHPHHAVTSKCTLHHEAMQQFYRWRICVSAKSKANVCYVLPS